MSYASAKWHATSEMLEDVLGREPTVEEIEGAMIEEMAHEIEESMHKTAAIFRDIRVNYVEPRNP